jgi:hypothetical protein
MGINVFNGLPTEIKNFIHDVRKSEQAFFIQLHFTHCITILLTMNCNLQVCSI